MENVPKTDQAAPGPPRCPRCGSALELHPLEVKDEDDGEGELLLLLDCPQGDFHTALTHRDLAAAATNAVMKRLGVSRPSPAP